MRKPLRIHENNKLILKSHQRFRSEKPNVFTGEVSKTALSVNNDKGIHFTGFSGNMHMEQMKK